MTQAYRGSSVVWSGEYPDDAVEFWTIRSPFISGGGRCPARPAGSDLGAFLTLIQWSDQDLS